MQGQERLLERRMHTWGTNRLEMHIFDKMHLRVLSEEETVAGTSLLQPLLPPTFYGLLPS
jgi:hypothetical protein